MSPMGTTGEADGAYCIDGINYFMERAKGGAGLIITGPMSFLLNMSRVRVRSFLIFIM
ncbi:hypothetical protein GCM10008910_19690 [Faecalicatena orotica]|uniref:Uncharacterized protein n=2 Tax=Faecalicatena orotica TaxID=1544 RepID=A0A2Y9B858_9FIRM|nr:hypothetical protein A8806_101488 [Faecalicatena orotica]SSA54033.1 hypothetical protein SAMN05216536_101488 [Faecalicatena orotica]